MKVGFISLGCSKNLVVTEEVMGLFKKHHFEIVSDAIDADILIINTCGFILAAKEEGIDTILEMAEYKKKNCKYLIVMGCLVERYLEELKKELPEVDLFLPIKDYKSLWSQIGSLLGKNEEDSLDFHSRVLTTGPMTAYLKIAEGCSNFCTYCAIPSIQGPYVSRDFESIIEEAQLLAEEGIEELIVIAQDTTKYGVDLYGTPRLADLLKRLSQIKKFKWIRFLYAYPEGITKELIQVVKENENLVPYFDIPIQHISNDILKRMNRKSDKESICSLIKEIREEIPHAILRTTFIVGFPGETQKDFLELLSFVKEFHFDKLGAFSYSREDHTPAYFFPNQVDEKIKEKRRKQVMELQAKISKENLEKHIGFTYLCLVENISEDGKFFIGRSYMDVPNEDGVIYIPYDSRIVLHSFITVKITNALEYDLVGEFIDEENEVLN